MKIAAAGAVLTLGLLGFLSPARAEEEKVALKDVPEAVLGAVKARFPGAELTGAEKETEDGKTTYEVALKHKGKAVDVSLSAGGKVLEIETVLAANDLPKAVAAAVEARHPGSKVKVAEEVIEFEDGEEEKIYEVQVVTKDGKEVELKLDEKGEIEDDDGKGESKSEGVGEEEFTAGFGPEKSHLVSTGRNPYFILEPGHQLVLEGDGDRLTITVLDETKVVDGVETRVVEERETEGGKLVEVSRNYMAISKRTNSVYYFGEDVDEYKNGKVAGHGGSWLSGKDGAKFGLLMPGQPLLGARYQQELAPGKAMDRAEVVGLGETVKTPAGEFKHCLKTEETNPLKPDEEEAKFYAPGVGLVQEESLKLVRHGKVESGKK